MHARAPRTPRTPTGAGSSALYDGCSTCTRPRSSRSTGPSRWGWRDGPDAGLLALDALADERSLRGFHLVPAARGDLLARAGRTAEARAALEQAAALAPTEQEKRQLRRRSAGLA